MKKKSTPGKKPASTQKVAAAKKAPAGKKPALSIAKNPYQEIPLASLTPNPFNPRQSFEGPSFDALTASIRAVGVIVPILARPYTGKKKGLDYEIVAGERRWRAACTIAKGNGGMNGAVIPAVVRDMTDDEAFEVMVIENLQREDISELEEAQNFKAYVDRKGPGSEFHLAERIGMSPGYISRRVAVLALPEKILKAWDKGDIKYGHCEQLARLQDEKRVMECFEELIDELDYGEIWTVHELKDHINRMSVLLGKAKFDTGAVGCLVCRQNSDVQGQLFDSLDIEKTVCFDPACFKQKQTGFLEANWKKMHWGKNDARTNGFRFDGNGGGRDYKNFSHHDVNPAEQCFACPHFVSMIDLDGKLISHAKQICVGDKTCFNAVQKAMKSVKEKASWHPGAADGEKSKAASAETSAPPVDIPRVAWHGEHFREEFYKTRLPEVFNALDYDTLPGNLSILQAALFALLHSNSGPVPPLMSSTACKPNPGPGIRCPTKRPGP